MHNNALSITEPVEMPVASGKLAACQHLPMPFFLITGDLKLLETNLQGERALDNHWLGISNNKLNFNSRANDLHVKLIIERLQSKCASEHISVMYSECFILRLSLIHI